MNKLNEIHELLKDVEFGRLITRKESVELLKLPENSIEAAHLRSCLLYPSPSPRDS